MLLLCSALVPLIRTAGFGLLKEGYIALELQRSCGRQVRLHLHWVRPRKRLKIYTQPPTVLSTAAGISRTRVPLFFVSLTSVVVARTFFERFRLLKFFFC